MKIISKYVSVIVSLILLISLSQTPTQAQTASTNGLAQLRADDVTGEVKENNVEGAIVISNLEKDIVPEFYVALELNKIVQDNATERITKIINGPHSIDPLEKKEFAYKINIPDYINTGNYFIKATIKNSSGGDLSFKMKTLGEIRGKNLFLDSYWADSKIIKNNQSLAPLSGPSYTIDEGPVLSLKCKNSHDINITAIPSVEIYDRTDIGKNEPLKIYSLERVEFSSQFTKVFRINLEPITNPGVYYVIVKMQNENNDQVSGFTEFRYVVEGTENAKILATKFDKTSFIYKTTIIGPADGSALSNGNIIFKAYDGEAVIFSKQEKIDILGARPKEYAFSLDRTKAYPDTITTKLEIVSEAKKVLDSHSENIELIKKTVTPTPQTPDKSGFNWFLVLFMILFAIIGVMLIYIRKKTTLGNYVLSFLILCSIICHPELVSGSSSQIFAANSCSQTSLDDWNSYCANFTQEPVATDPTLNDSGANGQTFPIGGRVTLALDPGGIAYSCSNAYNLNSSDLQCTGNTKETSRVSDGGQIQITCECVAAGPGGASGSAQNSLTAECWTCQNGGPVSSNWTCAQAAQTPVVNPPINPNIPNIPVPSWPQIWPTDSPNYTPIPTASLPSPTPTYIPVAFPTNRPGAKAPGSVTIAANQVWRCLKSSLVDGAEHKLKVVGDGFTNTEAYVVGCLLTSDGNNACTTGSDEIDRKLSLGSNNYTRLSQSNVAPLPYLFAVEANSKKITSDNRLEAVVYSQSAGTTTHFFYGVTLDDNIINADAKTLKYNTFTFDSDLSKCTSVRWDPTGFVYDANSYMPLSNVALTLLDVNMKKLQLPGVSNIIVTNEYGKFDFFIEPGSYYLEVNLPKGYKMPYGQENIIKFEEKTGELTHITLPLLHE